MDEAGVGPTYIQYIVGGEIFPGRQQKRRKMRPLVMMMMNVVRRESRSSSSSAMMKRTRAMAREAWRARQEARALPKEGRSRNLYQEQIH